MSDQLDLIQNSHDAVLTKQSQETELLSKEITQLAMKERDAKQKLVMCENELSEVQNQLRSLTTELDTRT